MLAKYANQNMFQINRDMPAKGTQKKYLAIYQDNIFDAMQDLSGEAAIKVYIYLCSNQNSFNLDFSPKHCAMACGISENSARNATKQLIEKGYLVQDSKNHYQFSESPQKKPMCLQTRERNFLLMRKFIDYSKRMGNQMSKFLNSGIVGQLRRKNKMKIVDNCIHHTVSDKDNFRHNGNKWYDRTLEDWAVFFNVASQVLCVCVN